MKHPETGDGDYCPQDSEHGRMWVTATKRQFCPSARHVGELLYEYDGLTPVSRSAVEPVSKGIGGARPRLSTTSEQPASAEGFSTA